MADFDPIEIQKHLKGVEYPATRDEIIDAARDNDAPEEIIEQLEDIDEESFDSPTEVVAALSE